LSEARQRVALVTGGARGIGRACARTLAGAGHDIVLVDLLVPEMERTAGEIREAGRDVMMFEADVASFSRAQEVVAAVKQKFGRIDFLLNNAGKAMPKGILEIAEDEFDRTIAINLKSCFNYIRAVAPIMLAQGGGRIASMSSINALSGGVTAAVSRFAYASAKAGILGMTRSLAKELGLSGLEEEAKAPVPVAVPPEMERQMAWETIKELITKRSDPATIATAIRERLHARYDDAEVKQSWLTLIQADAMSLIRTFCQLPYLSDGRTDSIARAVMETYVSRLTHEKYAATYTKIANSLRSMHNAKPDSPTLLNFLALVRWVDPEAANKLSTEIGMPMAA